MSDEINYLESQLSEVDILHSTDPNLQMECDVYIPFSENLTIDKKLHKAIFFNHSLQDLKCLIAAGADVDARGMGKKTPLHVSIEKDEYFDFFLANTNNIDAQDAFGETALTLALQADDLVKAEKLLAKGADPSIADSFNENAVDIAFAKGYIDLITKYYKVDKDALGGQILDTFHTFMKYGKSEVDMQELVDLGVDINAKDVFGNAPIHNAIARSNLLAVRFLVEHGANLQAKDAMGEVPLLIAKLQSKPEIFNFLLDSGAKLEKIEPRQQQDSLLYLLIKDLVKYIKKKVF